ncbi:hypothetical protein RND81_03G123300 [Saponaria officinalis]|uniref:Transmembrane protein n=1 Tax=Saponaria officinalis TaxID=3572 RepID=A0AAW1M777_SAPOF
MEQEGEYGWGCGSIMAFIMVLFMLLFLPWSMNSSPISPPSSFTLLLIPFILILLFIILSSSS